MTFEMPVGEWVEMSEDVIQYLRDESTKCTRWYLLARNGWKELEIGHYEYNENSVHRDGFFTASGGRTHDYMVQMVMPFENPKFQLTNLN